MQPLATTRKRTPTFDGKLVHLLDVAAQVFAEEGYAKASMRRIAAASEISLAGIYHYVAGKEELLYWIQFHTFDSLVRSLQRCIADIDDPRERLTAAVRNHVRLFGENIHALKVCARELETLEGEAYDAVRGKRRAYFDTVHDVVKALAPRGGAHPDSWLATANLFGMMNWFYQWYDAERSAVSLDDLAAQQAALFLDGYAACATRDVSEEHA